MNKKRTNYLVMILNLILIISIQLCYSIFSYDMKSLEAYCPIKFNTIINLVMSNIKITIMVVCGIVGILNIICAIQNKKNKNLCFWQSIFGIFLILINFFKLFFDTEILEYTSILIFGIIPIVLVISHFVFIKKFKLKVINIILYIIIIIFSVICIINYEICKYWGLIIIIMGLISIYSQESGMEEDRKINIILYYIIQLILVIGFLSILLFIIFTVNNYNEGWKKRVLSIYDSISTMKDISNQEIYYIAKKDNKYGFINEKGEEKIPCMYDLVSYFCKGEINNKECYFAFVKQQNKNYIISKSNQKIEIAENEYIKDIENSLTWILQDNYEENESENSSRVIFFNTGIIRTFMRNEINIQKSNYAYYEEPNFQEEDNKLYYQNENYSITLEEKEDTKENLDGYKLYNVVVRKKNGEENSSVEYIETSYSNNIYSDINGYIFFKSVDGNTQGFYDKYGNKVNVPIKFNMGRVLNNAIILIYNNDYYIFDYTGKLILKSNYIDIYGQNSLIIENDNGKMELYDENLNRISEEYDVIFQI